MSKEIIVNDVQDGDVIRYYFIDLEVDGKEISVTIEETHYTNPDFIEITNIEFIEGHEKITSEELDEIDDWLFDNSDSWRGN